VQQTLDGLAASFDGLVADANVAAISKLVGMMQREALILTFNDCLLLMSGVFFVALLFMPLVRRPGAPVAADH
jgi:MFS transporter, DHA2 family, multidrug resistance protein